MFIFCVLRHILQSKGPSCYLWRRRCVFGSFCQRVFHFLWPFYSFEVFSAPHLLTFNCFPLKYIPPKPLSFIPIEPNFLYNPCNHYYFTKYVSISCFMQYLGCSWIWLVIYSLLYQKVITEQEIYSVLMLWCIHLQNVPLVENYSLYYI